MKKYLKILFCSLTTLVVLSCNNSGSENMSDSLDTVSNTPDVAKSTLADSVLSNDELEDDIELFSGKRVDPVTKKVEVQIISISGYGDDELFARMSADTLKLILNSAGFKRAVINTNFPYHNNGMNGQQIYDTIMRAHEVEGLGGRDGILDLRLRTITEEQDGARWIRNCNQSTIGIDGGGSGLAAVCANWLRTTGQGKHYSWMAAHFIHEYMHILDFSHPNHKSESVPYKIHSIVENLVMHPKLRN